MTEEGEIRLISTALPGFKKTSFSKATSPIDKSCCFCDPTSFIQIPQCISQYDICDTVSSLTDPLCTLTTTSMTATAPGLSQRHLEKWSRSSGATVSTSLSISLI